MVTASAVEVDITFASIVNKRGRATVGNKRSVQSAMDERLDNMTSRLTVNLIDCDSEEAYPISAYSYFIVNMKQSGNCSDGRSHWSSIRLQSVVLKSNLIHCKSYSQI